MYYPGLTYRTPVQLNAEESAINTEVLFTAIDKNKCVIKKIKTKNNTRNNITFETPNTKKYTNQM